MKIGQDEFADRLINRFPIAKNPVICLGYRSPASMPAEQGDDMVLIMPRALEIKDQWALSMNTECQRCEHSPFNTMCAALPHHAARRETGIPIRFMVLRKGIQIVLYFARRIEPLEKRHLLCIEPKHTYKISSGVLAGEVLY